MKSASNLYGEVVDFGVELVSDRTGKTSPNLWKKITMLVVLMRTKTKFPMLAFQETFRSTRSYLTTKTTVAMMEVKRMCMMKEKTYSTVVSP